MQKIKAVLIYLRSSFWFVPGLLLCASIMLALGLIEIDNRYTNSWINDWPRLFGVGAEASRGMLSAIASSIMSMMTVAFSMTLVTLALASSQYTSRILRNFMRSFTTQVVLGIFAGIFTYCLIVLRTIRGGESSEYIPSISVFMGFVLAIVGVVVLVFFIHHIASSIQASNIISSAAEETVHTINKLFPEKMGNSKDENVEIKESLSFRRSITSSESGYIQGLGEQELINLACKWDVVIKMNYGVGDFIVEGMPLVSISTDHAIDEKMAKDLREIFSIRHSRTVEQDPLFGIRQIVDVALKALSPGVNDTTTGVMCVNYLTVILANLNLRKIPSNYRYSEHKLRVIVKAPDYEKYLHESFDQIRNNAKGNVAIIRELLTSIEVLSQLNPSPLHRHWLSKEADNIVEVLNGSIDLSCDKNELKDQFDRLKAQFEYS